MANQHSTEIATPLTPASTAAKNDSLLAPEIVLVLLTWFLFFTLLAVLKKFAWKPILKILDERENNIRIAVEEAEKTREEYLRIADKRKQILTEADNHAKEIINLGREASVKNAKLIEAKSKQEAQIIMENAHREIDAEQEKAVAYLRETSANAAVELAEKILRENLDAEKHKKIINSLIEKI